MFQTLINAFKVKEMRKKLLFTLFILVLYRLGSAIPIPGVNAAYVASQVDSYSMLGFLDLLSGGSFSDYSLFAMGVTPYITGSIVINLLTIAIPALERLSKQEDGRQKIDRITRFTGIGLALVQSVGIILGLGASAVVSTSFFNYAAIGIISTAGTAILVWLGEQINDKGIGNGISLLIFASIVSQVPKAVITWFNTLPWWLLIVMLVLIVLIVVLVVLIDQSERRIPVQYAKRVVGRKMYGGNSTNIPIKPNANGVMALIFAITILQLPAMIAQFVPNSGFYNFYTQYLGTRSWIYYVVYALLILAFNYFYTSVSFNPIEISKNLQQYGGFIPGIRPGRPTSDYIHHISGRLCLFGALFLMIIAIVPTVLFNVMGTTSPFGATSVLIMVSVALETMNQLENQMMMRHYKGFLNN